MRPAFAQRDAGQWLSHESLLTAMFEVGFPFRIQGSLINRDFLLRHELFFDEGISFTEEAQLMLEAARHTRFVFVEAVGLLVTRHDENVGDQVYAEKRVLSYERRVRRMKQRFGGTLAGAERRAFYNALCGLQSVVMLARAEDGSGLAKTVEAVRLLTLVPTLESVKRVVKMFLGMPPPGR